ncbi:MAG TPA: helix-turn-helix domain-containing protein [Burkholderiales bacterium]|nr:helix-turn-helix domain-containing protein [Burkholderiales bacterium]
MRRRQRKSDCPVHFALEVFGDAWTLLVIRDLMFKNRTTYTELLRAEEGIATNILADRLVRLEQDGIIAKERDSEHTSASHYRLTTKGIDLLPIMLEIIQWSAKHDPRTAAPREFVKRLRTEKPRLTTELRSALETHPERQVQGKSGRAARHRRDRPSAHRKNRKLEVSS